MSSTHQQTFTPSSFHLLNIEMKHLSEKMDDLNTLCNVRKNADEEYHILEADYILSVEKLEDEFGEDKIYEVLMRL